MTHEPEVSVLIRSAERVPSGDPNGNPRWRLLTDKGSYTTAVNSQCAFYFSSHSRNLPATLHLDSRGHVCRVDIDPHDM